MNTSQKESVQNSSPTVQNSLKIKEFKMNGLNKPGIFFRRLTIIYSKKLKFFHLSTLDY